MSPCGRLHRSSSFAVVETRLAGQGMDSDGLVIMLNMVKAVGS